MCYDPAETRVPDVLNFHNLSRNSVFQSQVFIMKISLRNSIESLSLLPSPSLSPLSRNCRAPIIVHPGLCIPKVYTVRELRSCLGINYNREFRKKIDDFLFAVARAQLQSQRHYKRGFSGSRGHLCLDEPNLPGTTDHNFLPFHVFQGSPTCS